MKEPIKIPKYKIDLDVGAKTIERWGVLGYAGEEYCNNLLNNTGAGVMEAAKAIIEKEVKKKKKGQKNAKSER